MKTEENDIRILKVGNCTSLSGKTKLRYEIGTLASGEFQLRISKSTGNGFYSKDWVGWDKVLKVLDKNGAKPITSYTLAPLFTGKSVNTPGFLLAALKQEGLVQRMETMKRCYERLDGAAFAAELKALSGTAGKATPAAKKAVSTALKSYPTGSSLKA